MKKGKLSATAYFWTDRRIWQSLETSPSTVARVRETFVMKGLEAVFTRKRHHPCVKHLQSD